MPVNVPITLALSEYDHVRDLLDGTVPVPGVDLTVLDQLLDLYVLNRVCFYLLESAASELASRQKAMKSATDNAQQLINSLTTEINQARQAQITQEITEIVGGASALTEAASAE